MFLAEDDPELRAVLAQALARDGYHVVTARNGEELIDRLTDTWSEPDEFARSIVISDLRMPGAGGLDVLSGLRLYGWDLPFVAITGFGDPETHATARRLGALAVLDKPFDVAVLRRIVAAWANAGA